VHEGFFSNSRVAGRHVKPNGLNSRPTDGSGRAAGNEAEARFANALAAGLDTALGPDRLAVARIAPKAPPHGMPDDLCPEAEAAIVG